MSACSSISSKDSPESSGNPSHLSPRRNRRRRPPRSCGSSTIDSINRRLKSIRAENQEIYKYDIRKKTNFQPNSREKGSKLQKPDLNWDRILPYLPKVVKSTWLPDVRSPEEEKEVRKVLRINVIDLGSTPCVINNIAKSRINPDIIDYLISNRKFLEPTPIQAITWPTAFQGIDFIGIAHTGQGKTLAYAVPAFLHVLNQDRMTMGDGPIVLVAVPTRELCVQVRDVFLELCDSCSDLEGNRAKACCAHGGLSGPRRNDNDSQCDANQESPPEIMVATLGRLLDLLRQGTTNLKRASFFVVDECDLIVETGFHVALLDVMNHMRPDKQTLLFSASFKKAIRSLAVFLCKGTPVLAYVGDYDEKDYLGVGSNVTQNIIDIPPLSQARDEGLRLSYLTELLNRGDIQAYTTIIFVDNKDLCEYIAELLFLLVEEGVVVNASQWKHQILSVHGYMHQSIRESRIRALKNGDIRILVATDLASRGIHAAHIRTVIQYKCPDDIARYINRIGRAAHCPDQMKGNSYVFVGEEGYYIEKDVRALAQRGTFDPAGCLMITSDQ